MPRSTPAPTPISGGAVGGMTVTTGSRSEERRVRSELSSLARGSTMVLIGNGVNGVFKFVFAVIAARALGAHEAGVLLEVIAMFAILTQTAEMGTDTGLSRFVPRYRALGRTQDLRRTFVIALSPVLLLGLAFAVATMVFAPQLARIFVHGGSQHNAIVYMRMVALFVPLAAANRGSLASSRGFGTMLPYVAVADLGIPGSRVLFGGAVLLLGLGAIPLAISWSVPVAVGFAAMLLTVYRLIKRAERLDGPLVDPPRRVRALSREFWAFSAPRALAGVFQVTILSLDVLLLGALRSSAESAIYAAASRYAAIGIFAVAAVGLALGPQISWLLAKGEHHQAQSVFQAATYWLMAVSFPFALAAAVFAPLIMSIYGSEFVPGQHALLILALAMLPQLGTGNNKIVLLMGGKSSWNLFIIATEFAINISLNLLLIPRYGMVGAAVAWAVAILFDNIVSTLVLWKLVRLHPFGPGYLLVVSAAMLSYGGVGLAVRFLLGLTWHTAILYGIVATLTYAVMLWRFREQLHLSSFRQLIRTRRVAAVTADPAMRPDDPG